MTPVAYKVAFAAGAGLFAASMIAGAAQVVRTQKRLPGLPPELMNNIRQHLAKGELRQAAREYRLASRIDPMSYDNLPELAQAMRRAGDVEGEMDQYRQARDRWPLDPATHRALGRALCRNGRLDEGIASLRKALELRPEAETELALGDAWLDHDRYVDALQAFSEAARLDPTNAAAHNGRGIALALSGDTRRAVEAFSEAVRLSPGPLYATNLDRARAALASAP